METLGHGKRNYNRFIWIKTTTEKKRRHQRFGQRRLGELGERKGVKIKTCKNKIAITLKGAKMNPLIQGKRKSRKKIYYEIFASWKKKEAKNENR